MISMLRIVIALPPPPVHCFAATVVVIHHNPATAIAVAHRDAHQRPLPPPPLPLSVDCTFVYCTSTVHLTPPAICCLSIAPLIASGGESGW
jgi:hypothetical protein